MRSWLQMQSSLNSEPSLQETHLQARTHHIRQGSNIKLKWPTESRPLHIFFPHTSLSIPCCLLSLGLTHADHPTSDTFLFSACLLQPKHQGWLTGGPHFLLPHHLARWTPCGTKMGTEFQEAVKWRVLMCLFR